MSAKDCFIRSHNTSHDVFCQPADVLTELDIAGLAINRDTPDGTLSLHTAGNSVEINGATARALAAELIRYADSKPSLANDEEPEETLDSVIARFRELALRGRKKGLHSGGTVRCIKYAEWLWQNAPELAATDHPAIVGFSRLVTLANEAPFLVRQILQDEGIVDEKGKEPQS